MHARELWESRALGPLLARVALAPASLLYALGWEAYLATYRLGLKRSQSPHRPIVCVGNLAVGGSGKTPVTLHLADVLGDLGRQVIIGCSGYGSPHAEGAAIAPDGPLDPREWGDEPAMIRWLMPGIPLVVGRGRVLAAQLVHERFSESVLLMDDGFQHLPLAKQVSIVLEEPNPTNKLCLPAGPYREPPWNLSRADLVIPGQFNLKAGPMEFLSPPSQQRVIPKEYAVLCALGNPARFLGALQETTSSIAVAELLLPDHDPLDAGNLWERLPADRSVVVTAKDWVKLRTRADIGSRDIVIARQSVRIEPAAVFRTWIDERLTSTNEK